MSDGEEGDVHEEELIEILALLAEERPLFHSEADFQLALAWATQRRFPPATVQSVGPYSERPRPTPAHLPGDRP